MIGISILEKSFNNTVSILLYIIFLVVFIAIFFSWIYLPFAIISIKKELKKIRELLEAQNKINID